MRGVLFVVFFMMVSRVGYSMPNENVFNALIESYPNITDTKLFNCTTCHTRNKWLRNAYGQDLQDYLRSLYSDEINAEEYTQAMIVMAMGEINEIDSDGDGYTNIEEFNFGTYPGNKDDYPRVFKD